MNPNQPNPQPQIPPVSPAPTNPSQPGYTPAPAPTNPGTSNGGHNPYEFIMNPNTKPKKPSVFAGLAGKLLLVVIGLLALGGVAMLIINLVVPSDPTIERMQGLLQQQVEVVRVSETIQRSATDPELKNVALTAQLSVDSSRQATESYLTSRNIKINPKTLGLKRNAETDTTLEAAKSSGTFDSTAATVLKDELQAYSQQIASDYKVIKGDKATKLTYENYRSAKYLADWAAERS